MLIKMWLIVYVRSKEIIFQKELQTIILRYDLLIFWCSATAKLTLMIIVESEAEELKEVVLMEGIKRCGGEEGGGYS